MINTEVNAYQQYDGPDERFDIKKNDSRDNPSARGRMKKAEPKKPGRDTSDRFYFSFQDGGNTLVLTRTSMLSCLSEPS